MNQEYLNKEKLREKFLYSKIIYREKYYEYWWNALGIDIIVTDNDWNVKYGDHGSWGMMDKWIKNKEKWKSDEEMDFNWDPIMKNLFINNLIIFERKLKLEKLLEMGE